MANENPQYLFNAEYNSNSCKKNYKVAKTIRQKLRRQVYWFYLQNGTEAIYV